MRQIPVRRLGRRPTLLGLTAALAVALLTAGPAAAATLTVCPSGCQYTTIAGALADAADGDEIQIAAGTYDGGFTIDKDVRLVGAGADQTTISGGSPVVTIAPDVSTRISKVTITGGTGGIGNGFFGPGAELTLEESTVSGISGGRAITNNGTLTLKKSTVSGNTFGGIFNGVGRTLTLEESTVSGNSVPGFNGGGINNQTDSSLTLVDSTVSSNTGADHGGGIFNGGTLTIEGSTVSNNTASAGGGIFNGSGATATLTQTAISDNASGNPSGQHFGGGIRNFGTMTLEDSEVTGNTVTGDVSIGGGQGAGIDNSDGTMTLRRTTVSGNTATHVAGIRNNDTMTLEDSSVIDNTSTLGHPGGIVNDGGAHDLTLVRSTVSNNTGAGIAAGGGTTTLIESTVSGNSVANGNGAGISVVGTLILEKSIVTGNSTNGNGGAASSSPTKAR